MVVGKEELPYLIDDSLIKNYSSAVLKNGDVVIADAAEDETVGKCSEIKGIKDEKILSGLHTIPVRPRFEFENGYLGYFMNSHSYHDQLLPLIQGTKVSSISKKVLENTVISYPASSSEQEKIATFFENLTNLITLHQRKSKISFSEVIFYNFTHSWEQRKLGDVFKEYSEKNHLELPPLTIIQGKGTILREESDRNLQYDKANLVGYKLVRKNDLIVHLRSFEGGLEKANSDGIVSPAYHMFHGDNTDTRFYYPFFRSRRFIDSLLKPHVYGIRDGKSIDIEGMKTIFIPVPSYEEQKTIGDFIESLDNLITLHQRKQS